MLKIDGKKTVAHFFEKFFRIQTNINARNSWANA